MNNRLQQAEKMAQRFRKARKKQIKPLEEKVNAMLRTGWNAQCKIESRAG